jgi:hypothetical protein
MDLIRRAEILVTTGEQPFRFLQIVFNQTASAQLSIWDTGAQINLTKPTDNDLRVIIAACQSGLGEDA